MAGPLVLVNSASAAASSAAWVEESHIDMSFPQDWASARPLGRPAVAGLSSCPDLKPFDGVRKGILPHDPIDGCSQDTAICSWRRRQPDRNLRTLPRVLRPGHLQAALFARQADRC